MDEHSQSILNRFQHGDLDAFEELFRLHHYEVYGWSLRLVRDPSVADEVTIECFWRIHRAHARFDPRKDFAPWARRIATNVAMDWMRAQRTERGLRLALPADVPAPTLAEPCVSAEIRNAFEAALKSLPPKLRVAAVLTLVEELPQKEAAEELGITLTALKVRVHRAVKRLRVELTKRGIEP
jgi:RNA polymerase sigma-70 factor (ECF subfamily)